MKLREIFDIVMQDCYIVYWSDLRVASLSGKDSLATLFYMFHLDDEMGSRPYLDFINKYILEGVRELCPDAKLYSTKYADRKSVLSNWAGLDTRASLSLMLRPKVNDEDIDNAATRQLVKNDKFPSMPVLEVKIYMEMSGADIDPFSPFNKLNLRYPLKLVPEEKNFITALNEVITSTTLSLKDIETPSIDNYRIRTNSHIINLLGDELIGSDSLALFEIVKNSYDADANVVTISLRNLFSEDRSIVIEDDGNGMTPGVIERAWLTIGTDYKRKSVKVSPVLHRTSLGNKGVGRLAVHRLANRILLETLPRGFKIGSRLCIDWDDLINSSEEVEGLSVNVENNIPNLLNGKNGTRIILTQLREDSWTKSKVTQMVRKLQNIINPFEPSNQFKIEINSNIYQVQQWIDGVRTPVETLSDCLYQYSFTLEKGNKANGLAQFSWHYRFNPKNFPPSSEIVPRENSRVEELLINGNIFHEIDLQSMDKMLLRDSDLDGIESISGTFYAFNLDGKIIDLSYGSGNRGKIKEFVSEYAGVRVFRDGIRVYNYGEPADDWLYLDQSKTKRMGSHFAKGQTVGAINLSLEDTKDTLKEKTNREGFIENTCFERLVAIVQTVFSHFERLSIKDREKINAYQHDTVAQRKIGFSETVDQLEESIKKLRLEQQLGGLVKKVRRDYDDMRDVMLNSGMNGLNLTIVFHEVSREIAFIGKDITRTDCDIESIRKRVEALNDLIEKFMPMLKQTRKITLKASALAERAIAIHKNRFSFHKIKFECPMLESQDKDFKVYGVGGLLLSALSNILDNAIYWSCENAEREGGEFEPSILLSTDLQTFDGPALIVADNGAGFKMEEDEMILPFRTLKPSSMGVGLYYVSLVMNMVGGKLIFTNQKELNIPDKYNGACVALVFPKI